MTCLLCQRSAAGRMTWVLFLSIAVWTVAIPRSDAAEIWDYVRVGKDFVNEPRWAARQGKARVDIRGDRIEIRIDYTDADDGMGKGAVAIVGTINSAHAIGLIAHLVGTPLQDDIVRTAGRLLRLGRDILATSAAGAAPPLFGGRGVG
jgi:hypothetical protein